MLASAVMGLDLSYSEGKNILSSSNSISGYSFFFAIFLATKEYGKKNINIDVSNDSLL